MLTLVKAACQRHCFLPPSILSRKEGCSAFLQSFCVLLDLLQADFKPVEGEGQVARWGPPPSGMVESYLPI